MPPRSPVQTVGAGLRTHPYAAKHAGGFQESPAPSRYRLYPPNVVTTLDWVKLPYSLPPR